MFYQLHSSLYADFPVWFRARDSITQRAVAMGCRALRRSALAGTGLFYELASGSINYRAFGSNAVYVLFFFLFFLFFSSPVHFFQTNKIDRVKIVDRCNVYGWKIRIETSLSLRLAQSFLFNETWTKKIFQFGNRERESVEKFYRIDVSQDRVVWQKVKPSWFRDAAFRGKRRRAIRSKRQYYIF